MAIINFPPTAGEPTDGSFTYTFDGVLYSWTGSYWTANTQSGFDNRYVEVAGDTMTGDLTVPSLNGGQLAGLRNVLINGAVTINQRGVTYAAAAVGDYWADRWKKTAGGMIQIVEEGNYKPSTSYTLSGTGVATQAITSPATGDWTIPDVTGTATMIQLEEGTVATPFELRPIGLELSLCQRYFQRVEGFFESTKASPAVAPTSSLFIQTTSTMRDVPTATYYDFDSNVNRITTTIGTTNYNNATPTAVNIRKDNINFYHQDSVNISSIIISRVDFDAEL